MDRGLYPMMQYEKDPEIHLLDGRSRNTIQIIRQGNTTKQANLPRNYSRNYQTRVDSNVLNRR